MANNFLNLITKLSEALLNSKKEPQKSAYKPETDKNNNAKPSYYGDFSAKSQTVISPKQSVVEMLRNHEKLSKRIDDAQKKV